MRRSLLLAIALLAVSPVFGVYLAGLLGYHEPLDIAAEALGLRDTSDEINWTPLKDYTFPGLPDWLGYIVSGAVGLVVIVAIGLSIEKILSRRR